jgi:hypothetical protein
MFDFLAQFDNGTHLLAALLLFSRLGDVISTRLVTPQLRLETNPIVRRLGWPFAVASLAIVVIPYFHAGIGVALIAGSLLVSASNLSRGWLVRALGEAEYEKVVLRAARQGSRAEALSFVIAAGAFVVITGLVLMWLTGSNSWGYWFGLGIAIDGVVLAGYGSLFVLRTFRRAAVSGPA